MKHLVFLCLLFIAPQLVAETTSNQTLMIKLKVADAHYELLDSWLLSRSYPSTVDTPGAKELRWQLLDANHQVLTEGWIADPQLITGALVDDGHSTQKSYRHEGEHRLDSATVILRVPYDARIKSLQIERHPEIVIAAQDASARQKPAPVERAEFSINPRPAIDKK